MTLSTNIYARISAVEDIAGDLESTRSSFADRDPIQLADGTTANKADKKWSDTRTLGTGANETLDLNALTDSLGRTINFAKVKAIRISAAAANTTDLTVGNATSNQFQGPLGAAANTLVLKPGVVILLADPVNGWSSANSAADQLKITNASGASATYDIEIIGTSA